jgi:hypothetical protein
MASWVLYSLRIRIMSDFCRIIRIMSNTDNVENRIRIHPSTDSILTFNMDNSDFQTLNPSLVCTAGQK